MLASHIWSTAAGRPVDAVRNATYRLLRAERREGLTSSTRWAGLAMNALDYSPKAHP